MSIITIEKVIAHDLNLGNAGPIFFPQLIIVTDEEVKNFFAKHIENALKTKQVRLCKFTYQDAAVLRDTVEIANDTEDDQTFIDSTVNMTQSLFNNMSGAASNGALIFIQYFDTQKNQRFLGILKMDPNNGISLNRDTFSFKVEKDILPSVNERLHKCAFIKIDENLWDEEVHLRVLDKQQIAGEISKYFLSGFLEANTIVDDKAMTELVNATIMDFAVEEGLITTHSQIVDFVSKVDQILHTGKEVDLERDLDSLFASYAPGEADRGQKIERYKEKLMEKRENVYFVFTADKKPTIAMYADEGNDIRIQFPVRYNNTTVIVGYEDETDGTKTTVIRFVGVELKEKFKH
ncbi:nucleoid-associated protein [Paenibacillus radicis (ex Xue et al. 2023)]|uniref:Nucleoid-associated protein n=1 Tax=Paenibacillus radicis (ex Xue et al. 2023) TaxID=2972489 RepID=A0ABT1YNE2_9BACL|nr:nucleoid-associated protein [Paenibacillus radicis (ex Xue et al. 2023)]MCR8633510.1 nucleoid-associated protein [Paenibacillus radicis (ex Xue et al. 2023)]